ncbi:Hypothetical_protein [Hexamita inflata]|uniref:Hypothetical_protein n=1 Tax=Hexamita inflata TaxID=28002 RepID=A0AA86PLP1_9EUKA|nr:Hypothetical protein HINF_LOCUS25119 [Hexamita inflata]
MMILLYLQVHNLSQHHYKQQAFKYTNITIYKINTLKKSQLHNYNIQTYQIKILQINSQVSCFEHHNRSLSSITYFECLDIFILLLVRCLSQLQFQDSFLHHLLHFPSDFSWVKYTQVYFKFLTSSFWKSGFMLLLGTFQFPSFESTYCQKSAFVFQNVCAIGVMVIVFVSFVVAVVDQKIHRALNRSFGYQGEEQII